LVDGANSYILQFVNNLKLSLLGNNVEVGGTNTFANTNANQVAIGNSNTLNESNQIVSGFNNNLGAGANTFITGTDNNLNPLTNNSQSNYLLGRNNTYSNDTSDNYTIGFNNSIQTNNASSLLFGGNTTFKGSTRDSGSFGYNNFIDARESFTFGSNLSNAINGNVDVGTQDSTKLTIENTGRVILRGPLSPNGNDGNTNEVLISQGFGIAPIWTNINTIVPATTNTLTFTQSTGNLSSTVNSVTANTTIPDAASTTARGLVTNIAQLFSGNKTFVGFTNFTNASTSINSPTAGQSGLRFGNLNSGSATTTGGGKVLAVNATGDVVLVDPLTTGCLINGSAYCNNGNTSGGDRTLGTNDAFSQIFETGNIERMRIAIGGNVGISTNNPAAKLEVNNGTSFNYPIMGQGLGAIHLTQPGTNDFSEAITFGSAGASAATAQAGIYVQGSGVYGTKMYFGTTNLFATGAQSRMVIDNQGNIGMGNVAPNSRLEITSNLASTSGLRFTNLLSTSATTTANGKVLTVNASGDVILTDALTGATTPDFWRAAGIRADNVTDDADQIQRLGAIQIGTNASIPLNSAGEVLTLANTAFPTEPTKLRFVNAPSGLAFNDGFNMELNPGANPDMKFTNLENAGIVFATNGNNTRMVVAASGNVGIGSVNPQNALVVASSSGAISGLRLGLLSTSATTTNVAGKVLTVNASGDVVLTDDGASIATGTTICSGSLSLFCQNGNSFATTSTLGTDNNALAFEVNNIERARLATNGFLGIGTTAPIFKLELSGTSTPAERKIGINGVQSVYIPDQVAFDSSSFFGTGGQAMTGGIYNTGVGIGALRDLTNGTENTAIGTQALMSNIGASGNTAIGSRALSFNTLGTNNTAIGSISLFRNTSGNSNTSVGYGAMFNNATGSNNNAIGLYSLYSNTGGSNNQAAGFYSLYNNTTGSNNIANGIYSLQNNTVGSSNAAYGYSSLQSNISGNYNTGLGSLSGQTLTTGIYNSFLGYGTGLGITTGSANTILGANVTGLASTTSNNIIIADGGGNIRLRADAVGNLGVGVPISSTIGNKFEITSSATSTSGLRFTNLLSTSATTTYLGKVLTVNSTGDVVLVDDGVANSNVACAGSLSLFCQNGNNFTGAGVLGTRNAFDQTFITNNTEKFRITQTGRLLLSNTTGVNTNLFMGQATGNETMTGGNNVAFGASSMSANTTGNGNSAIGTGALQSNTTGANNNAIGQNALLLNTTGNYNSAIGGSALFFNTTGSDNVAMGLQSLFRNTIGNTNIAIGRGSMLSNITGGSNISLGSSAMYSNAAGYSNSAFGNSALYSNATGSSNIALGDSAMYQNVNGSNGTAVGYQSQYYANSTTTAWDNTNTSVGYSSLRGSTVAANNTGGNNTAIGRDAMVNNSSGANNTAVGMRALTANTTGASNVAVGSFSLYQNTTGTSNSALGYGTLFQNTTGTNNSAMGHYSLFSNIGGSNNIANGIYSLYSNTTGGSNIANGSFAAQNNTTGSNNIAFGQQALYSNTIGERNLAFGANTGFSLISGDQNTMMGYTSGNNLATGSKNIFIGPYSGSGIASGTYNTYLGAYTSSSGITTGSYNTILGSQISGLAATTSNNIILADGAGNIRLRADATGNVGVGVPISSIIGNKFEITSSAASTSGLRFTNLLSTSATTTGNGKVLTVDTNGDVVLVDDSTAVLSGATNCSGSLSIFCQNGNSLATTATLGTNDNNALAFEVNNIERARFATSGYLGLGTTAPLRHNLTR
jgi:hypothetical protein